MYIVDLHEILITNYAMFGCSIKFKFRQTCSPLVAHDTSTKAVIRGFRAYAISLIAYARQPLIIARVDLFQNLTRWSMSCFQEDSPTHSHGSLNLNKAVPCRSSRTLHCTVTFLVRSG